MLTQSDEDFMRIALIEAERAAEEGEVPVGAIIVRDGRIIGRGRNACERLVDATSHAEILAIGAASRTLESWRLEDCTLYVTLEPCPMCIGACLNARVLRVVYGASEPKAGACGSIIDITAPKGYNHKLQVTPGILAEESSAMLKRFFRELREKRN